MSESNDKLQILRNLQRMIKDEEFKTQKEVIERFKEKFDMDISQATVSRNFRKLNIDIDPTTGYYVASNSDIDGMSDVESILYHVMRYANPDISSTKSTIRIFTDKPLENVISESVSAVYKEYIKGVIVGKGMVLIYITNKTDKSVTISDKIKHIKKTLISFRDSLDPNLENTFEI